MFILFNKPYGIHSQFTGDNPSETLSPFIPFKHVYPAGRLDKKSEGLLILTDDGRQQHVLSHPKHGKSKTYWVQVEGIPEENALNPLRKGLIYQGVSYQKAIVEQINPPQIWARQPPIRERKHIPTQWLAISISEGKNHQIRKMTASIGYPTLRLIRYSIGAYTIAGLAPGAYRIIE